MLKRELLFSKAGQGEAEGIVHPNRVNRWTGTSAFSQSSSKVLLLDARITDPRATFARVKLLGRLTAKTTIRIR